MSSIQADNPYWYDANHVLVPYCSSDSWSGTKIRAEARDGWSFMGSLIVRQVISDLIPLGLGRSHGGELLLAGSSAGGLGVMLNLDKLKKYLRHERGIKMTVRGVSDSGWFLDRAPYAPGAVATVDVVKQGYKLWGGALPDSCVKKHPTEPWRCYFGHRIYPTMNCKYKFHGRDSHSHHTADASSYSNETILIFQHHFSSSSGFSTKLKCELIASVLR